MSKIVYDEKMSEHPPGLSGTNTTEQARKREKTTALDEERKNGTRQAELEYVHILLRVITSIH